MRFWQMIATALTAAYASWATNNMSVPPGDWGGLVFFFGTILLTGVVCWLLCMPMGALYDHAQRRGWFDD